MKKIFVILCILFGLFFSFDTHAEEGCSTMTYYSKKEWVQYQNLFDADFKKEDSHFINSRSVVIKQNIFGKVDRINKVDSSVFYGKSVYTAGGSSDINYPTVFSIGFGKTIQVGKIQFQIEAVNTKTKKAIKKNVYVNASPSLHNGSTVYSKENKVLSTDDNERVTIDLGFKEIGSIEIFFEDDADENSYTLHSFQILEYKVKEHVEWVTDEILDTETKSITMCANQGKYNPDGTDGKWLKEAATLFSPSVSIISDYVPIITSRDISYDIGKTDYISPYSTPVIGKWMGGYTSGIMGWSVMNNTDINYFRSFGVNHKEFPYIQTSPNMGVIYEAHPRYWTSSHLPNYFASSNNSGWCKEVTGSSKTPCFKMGGHTNDNRLNLYDVEIFNYQNVVDPTLRLIKNSKYILINLDTKEEKQIDEGIDEIKRFHFKESGRWILRARIEDLANNIGTKDSKPFLIDNQNPNANFEVTSEDMTKPFPIRIIPYDEHSKVKKWSYSVSKDGGKTYFNHSEILTIPEDSFLVSETGDYVVKVYIEDNAGNTNIVESTLYNVLIESANFQNVLSPTYTINKPNPLYLQIKCEVCSIEPQKLLVFLEGKEIINHSIDKVDNNLVFEFIPITNEKSKLEIKIADKVLQLDVFEKSKEFKETSNNQLEFKGIVASGISSFESQYNFYETILVKYYQDKQVYYSGEGIDNKVILQSVNECAKIENYHCVMSDNRTLNHGMARMKYQDGAKSLEDNFKINNQFVVETNYKKEMGEFLLPQFYLERKEGTVYTSPQKSTIDGGRKWYTNPLADLKSYSIIAEGTNLGFNEFKWQFNKRYDVDRHYFETFTLRFADPKNPFPNKKSKLWNNREKWFLDLNINKTIRQEILD
ncbi:hypothetical protein [Anaerorhabdus sp.]|uniref:hypothetical protein n=1 Tax=Anaerorhabdus sp. TaxID=1872524 RepID=UPI002FC7FEB7